MSDKSTTVSRTIDASAADIFDVLTRPDRHKEIEGSGFIVSDDHTDRITESGQKFTMNMTAEFMGGDYQTDNHVNAYDKNHMVGWLTAPAGTEPPGWSWLWELKADGSENTEVTLTYDWANVTDEELLKKVSFPLISEKELEDSLSNLAAAVKS